MARRFIFARPIISFLTFALAVSGFVMSIIALTKEDKTGDPPCVCNSVIDVEGINFVNAYNTNEAFGFIDEELAINQKYDFITNLTQGNISLTNSTTIFHFRILGNIVFAQGIFINASGANGTLASDPSLYSTSSIPDALKPIDSNGQYTQSAATLVTYSTLSASGNLAAGVAKIKIGFDGKISITPPFSSNFYNYAQLDSYSFSYQLN